MATRAPAPPGFEAIHRILGWPMREVPMAAWPTWGHGGGPLPALPELAQVRVGVELAAPLVAGATGEVAACLALAAEIAAEGHASRHATAGDGVVMLDRASTPKKPDAPGLRVARLVLRSAHHFLHTAPSARSSIGNSVASAAVAYLGLVAPAEHTAYLVRVDQILMRHELGAALAERDLAPTSAPALVIARAPTPGGKLGCVLARLADGRFGLYAKLRARWEWHEGDLATMFATVPDALRAGVGDGVVANGLR